MWNIFVDMGVEKLKNKEEKKMINFYYIKI